MKKIKVTFSQAYWFFVNANKTKLWDMWESFTGMCNPDHFTCILATKTFSCGYFSRGVQNWWVWLLNLTERSLQVPTKYYPYCFQIRYTLAWYEKIIFFIIIWLHHNYGKYNFLKINYTGDNHCISMILNLTQIELIFIVPIRPKLTEGTPQLNPLVNFWGLLWVYSWFFRVDPE